MLAVVGLEVCLFVATRTAPVFAFLLGLVNHRCRYDTRRNGNDSVAQNHDQTGKETTESGNRRDVAISHGGQRDDGPVDTGGNVRECRIGLSTLDHKGECADDGDEDDDKEEIDGNLLETHPDALHQQVALVDEREEFEHPEDTGETECTQDEEIARAAEERNERQIEGQGSQQVDDAKETEGVVALSG